MQDEIDITFHSVVLIGVHDIKSLKLRIREEDGGKLNSPWNIAVDLEIDFAFTAKEIEPMLADYANERNIKIDISAISEKIFYYTSGNPFLVSKFCQLIDEKFIGKEKRDWTLDDVEQAYLYLVDGGYTTTNFDDVNKNLENNDDLFALVQDIAINGEDYKFRVDNPIITKGKTFGVLCKNSKGQCDISNKVYEFRIFDYMLSKVQTQEAQLNLYASREFKKNGELNVVMILKAYQRFLKEHHSSKDNKFLEKMVVCY
ncbi:MAG: hypothetical protein U9Q83_11065 [Bacteroidota bacterium]|nr:hypothetical protein [Bacteroidota bacterium]